MNKVMLVGRFVRDPETKSTTSGIKYSRFALAVDRAFGENQTDFIPVVAWRNQADFVDKYMKKGSLISLEGRFTSSNYQNQEGKNIVNYEVTAERVTSLETKAMVESRMGKVSNDKETPVANTQDLKFAEDNQPKEEDLENITWEMDL